MIEPVLAMIAVGIVTLVIALVKLIYTTMSCEK